MNPAQKVIRWKPRRTSDQPIDIYSPNEMSDEKRQDMIPISVCILTKNNEESIARCLAPLARFDEVLLLDTGSTDRTVEIAESFPRVRVFYQDGIDNFGKTRNTVTSRAKNDWVLHVDSDEVLTPDFVARLAETALDPHVVYAFRRRIFYQDRPIPPFDEWVDRLFHRKTTSWRLRAVHEVIEIRDDMHRERLSFLIEHYSYDSVEQLIQKIQMYSTLFADQFHEERNASPWTALLHGHFSFFKHFVLRRGFLYGYDGFIISYCLSVGSFLKYVKLFERNRQRRRKTVKS